jgi:hypothetical protein
LRESCASRVSFATDHRKVALVLCSEPVVASAAVAAVPPVGPRLQAIGRALRATRRGIESVRRFMATPQVGTRP